MRTAIHVLGAAALAAGMTLTGWAQEPASAWDALTDGTTSVNLRLRYEYVDQDGLDDANAWTARLRLGYATQPIAGLQAMVEFEGTETADTGGYNAAGVHGPTDKAVVADPESAEFNQAFLSYSGYDSTLKAGRQRIILGNARFVGNVGWRQNEQTYDAMSLRNQSLPGVDLFYGYVGQVNRIFGSEADGGKRRLDSDSHLANLSYAPCDYATLTGYGYFLDLDTAAALSSDTMGISLDGKLPFSAEIDLGCHAEFAQQSDAGDNPASYDADYLHLTLSGTSRGMTLLAGFEQLGSDRTGADEEGNATFAAFQTPLATLHKFNGFADKFLTTPDEGLEDIYVTLSTGLPYGLKGAITYHDFQSDEGDIDYGTEIDAVLSRALNTSTKLVAKFAHYDADQRFTDTDKLSLQMDLAF